MTSKAKKTKLPENQVNMDVRKNRDGLGECHKQADNLENRCVET